jgi:NodT family efflux transporter outer membrane factor (OMF) lipoprotein
MIRSNISADNSSTLPLSARTSRWLVLSLATLVLSGCQIGPKYVRPSVPLAPAYKENQAGSELAQAEGWKQANPQDQVLRGKWWEMFNDPELNALEEKLNIDNQNIVQYFQNYMSARAQVAQARAQLWPTITVGASGSRSRTPALQSTTTASGIATTTTTLQLPVSISWEPDLFGRIRNEIREYSAAAQVSAADLANERLSEQASLAQYYFELRGQDALQQIYDATSNSYRDTLKLTQALFKAGIDSQEDVASAETNLRSAEANAVAVATTRAQYEHAIALLAGQLASTFSIPVKPLSGPPLAIPTGVASSLLERRPDIAAAERTMAEQNALIGVGKAAYFPTISLSIGGGTESATWTNLANISNRYWSVSPSVSETVFNGGANRAAMRQYRAQYEASVAAYRETVLNAFKEVEDYLVASRQLAEQTGRQKLAVEASSNNARLAIIRYKTGVDPFLNVLTAQNTLFNNQLELAQLRTQQMTAAVQLIAALGGGWDSSQLPTDHGRNSKSDSSASAVVPARVQTQTPLSAQ